MAERGMTERVRRALAIAFLIAAMIAALLVPLRGITPVPGLLFLTLFLVAAAAKPEPGAMSGDAIPRSPRAREADRG